MGSVPRFYLHVYYGDHIASDEDGLECADIGQARGEAVSGIRSILAADLRQGYVSLHGRIVIMDDDNHVVLTVPFADAVTIDSV